jgi:hypothetical protein
MAGIAVGWLIIQMVRADLPLLTCQWNRTLDTDEIKNSGKRYNILATISISADRRYEGCVSVYLSASVLVRHASSSLAGLPGHLVSQKAARHTCLPACLPFAAPNFHRIGSRGANCLIIGSVGVLRFLKLNFEQVMQIIELKRFRSAPNGYPFAALIGRHPKVFGHLSVSGLSRMAGSPGRATTTRLTSLASPHAKANKIVAAQV